MQGLIKAAHQAVFGAAPARSLLATLKGSCVDVHGRRAVLHAGMVEAVLSHSLSGLSSVASHKRGVIY